MKKLNLICAAIALVCGTAANAGTLTAATPGGTVIAVENFGGSTSAATDAVRPGAVTYSLTNITAVNAGASVWFTVRLDGAKFAAAPGAATFQFAGQAGGTEIDSVDLSTDKTTVLVKATSGGGVNLGLGAFIYTPGATDIDTANTTLGAVGGVINATMGMTSVAPVAFEATDEQATVDSPLASAAMAVAAKAISSSLSALSTYTGKIDLTATPPASVYTTGGGVALGSFQFKNVTGTQNIRAGGADYTLLAGSGGLVNTGATVTVTPGAGQSFAEGSTLNLSTTTACLADVATTGSGTVAFTSTTKLTAKTLVTVVPVTTGTDWFVCMTPPGSGKTATPITATISAVVAPASTKDLIATVSGTGYPLDYNGSKVDVKTYFPAALSVYGYQSFIRVTNTGAVAAVVSGAFITETTGDVGGAFPLTGVLPAGASKVLTGAQIEAVLGAPAAADRPRLRLTAPTNGLQVQYFFQDAAGAINEISGGIN